MVKDGVHSRYFQIVGGAFIFMEQDYRSIITWSIDIYDSDAPFFNFQIFHLLSPFACFSHLQKGLEVVFEVILRLISMGKFWILID